MKNILVVFTGGTIGSIAIDGTINTASSKSYQLLELFQQHCKNPEDFHFSTVQPIQLLSENLAPCIWQTLIEAIEVMEPDRYDGIIITHGTDTLAYTAVALSFYYNAIKLPMLLVASDYPLSDPRANGLDNFMCALEFIEQNVQAGVFVPYRNQQQPLQVHQASRLTCSLQLSGDFFSIQSKSAMSYENQVFSIQKTEALVNLGDNKSIWDMAEAPIKHSLKANFSERILMIKPYPGLNYANFNLGHVDVVLHDLYHSGTACASNQWSENYSLVEFIKRCGVQKIKVYLAPAIKSVDAYQTTRALIEQGAEMIWNMSIEAAYVKLMLAYGNFSDELQILSFLETDIAGEHL